MIMIFFDFCSNLSSYLSRGSIFGGDEIDVVESGDGVMVSIWMVAMLVVSMLRMSALSALIIFLTSSTLMVTNSGVIDGFLLRLVHLAVDEVFVDRWRLLLLPYFCDDLTSRPSSHSPDQRTCVNGRAAG